MPIVPIIVGLAALGGVGFIVSKADDAADATADAADATTRLLVTAVVIAGSVYLVRRFG